MIVLGLGSNQGNRLAHLREAYHAIKKIPDFYVKQVSPVYISDALLPENAPPEWDKPHLNLALRCETKLSPHELLDHIKKIEKEIGRNMQALRWGPRVIDIDILVFNDLVMTSEKLTLPHEGLPQRPFALWPLADVLPLWVFPLPGPHYGKTASEIAEAWGSRLTGEAPLHTRQINQRVDVPQLVGVINMTPDSFSDGGEFFHTENAIAKMQALIEAGAEIIDIGAESTAPRARPINHKEEWQRLEPFFLSLNQMRNDLPLCSAISIDTRHAETARKAIEFGANWINDVTGFENESMRELLFQKEVHGVVMHHLSIPASAQHILPRHQDPVKLIFEWAKVRLDELENKGISREKMIFDPGIGFGKSPEHSYLLIKHAEKFSELDTRILLGYSRKSFLSLFTNKLANERDIETLSITLALANQAIDFLRVHDVEMCARGLKIFRAF